MRTFDWFHTVWRDLVFGARMLRKSVGFTATVVITLGIGIGITSSIFSAVVGILLREPPVVRPDRLFAITTSNPLKGDLLPASLREFSALAHTQAFAQLAAASYESQPITGNGEPKRVSVAHVTTNYFELLGINPQIGRTFVSKQSASDQEHDAIISYELWREKWGQDPNIIGKTLNLGTSSFVIVGVMPHVVQFATIPSEVWTPADFLAEASDPHKQAAREVNVVARLRDDVDIRAAQSEATLLFQRLDEEEHRTSQRERWVPSVVVWRDFLVGPNTPRVLFLVMFVVGFVLLIACANVAGITLARSAARQSEFALRVTLGAERRQLIQLLLVESGLLALASATVGVVLAVWGVMFLRARMQFSPPAAWLAEKMELSGIELIFALTITGLAVLICGLWPALQTSKPDLQGTLKEVGHTASPSSRQGRIQTSIVLGEITAAMLLMFITAASIQMVVTEMTPKLGFEPEQLLTLKVDVSGSKYEDPNNQIRFFETAIENLGVLPGIDVSAATQTLPESAPPRIPIEVDNVSFSTADERPRVARYVVSPGYLGAMKIPIVRGREFSVADRSSSLQVAIVNETFAQRFLAGSNPIGRRLRIYESDVADSREIVGVVGDVIDFVGQNHSVPQIYVPFLQKPSSAMVLVVRTVHGDPMTLAQACRDAIRAIDKSQPIDSVATMRQVLEKKGSVDRLIAGLLVTFTGVALCLSTIGTYGLISYMVARRTPEIGLRIALGAGRSSIFRMIASKAVKLTVIGIASGFVISILLSRALVIIRPESSARGLLILISAATILTLTALVASYLPARRAMRLDPNKALRHV